MAWNPLRPSSSRVERSDAVLTDQGPLPMLRTVARVRSVDEAALAGLAAESRAWFCERGNVGFTWWLGPSSKPDDAASVIRADTTRTFETFTATAMVLDHAPLITAAGIEVREITTFEDFVAMQRLLHEGATEVGSDQSALEPREHQMWVDSRSEAPVRKGYLALIDNRAVSAGALAILPTRHGLLSGAATAPAARGKGCYAALVAYRWRIARELSLDGLVVQASSLSRPILERLGFRASADLVAIIDQPSG